MASVKAYTTASGRRYRVRYRKPDGSQTDKRGFPTKKAAEAFAATVEVDKLTGSYVDPTLGRTTIGELGPGWLARKTHLKPSSLRPLEITWRVHVEPRWAKTRIMDIGLVEVEDWISELTALRSPTVVIRAYGILAGILDDAVRAKLLYANPSRGVENLPRKKRKANVYLTHDEVHAMARCAPEHSVLVLTLAYAGLRWGEAIALRVRDLSIPRKRIMIERNAVIVGMETVVGTPKNGKGRSVPIPDFLAQELAALCKGKKRDDLVFPGPDGGFMQRPKAERGWFDGARSRAGLERLTPHDLRHTAASLAVQAGANVKSLQKMLGHASAAMTLDVYTDLFDEDLTAIGDALNAAVLKLDVGKKWATEESDAA